jgi:hypothetical protein
MSPGLSTTADAGVPSRTRPKVSTRTRASDCMVPSHASPPGGILHLARGRLTASQAGSRAISPDRRVGKTQLVCPICLRSRDRVFLGVGLSGRWRRIVESCGPAIPQRGTAVAPPPLPPTVAAPRFSTGPRLFRGPGLPTLRSGHLRRREAAIPRAGSRAPCVRARRVRG